MVVRAVPRRGTSAHGTTRGSYLGTYRVRTAVRRAIISFIFKGLQGYEDDTGRYSYLPTYQPYRTVPIPTGGTAVRFVPELNP
jgi:hypothetical protein